MDTLTQVEELRRRLNAAGDPERARSQKAYLKTELDFHGVTAAVLREEARAFRRDHPRLGRSERDELVERLWQTPFHDLRSLGVALLELDARRLEYGDLDLVERLLERSADWAHVDYLSTKVAAPIVARCPQAVADLERWARSSSFWVRRASLLALLPELRAGRGDLDLFARLAEPMLEEREFFIRKAIGWVLREVGKKRPAPVHAFLERNLARVSGLTLREAVKYLPAGQRDALLEAHRSRHAAGGRRVASTASAYHLRRKDKALEDRVLLEEILARARYVTLAMCRDEQPYLVVVNHGLDRERCCLYFHCAGEGRKLDVLAANPRVWGIAVEDLGYLDGECEHAYRSVMFGGRVTFLADEAAKRHALEVMIRQQESDPGPVEARTLTPARLASVTIGRVDLEEMTGKQALAKGKPGRRG